MQRAVHQLREGVVGGVSILRMVACVVAAALTLPLLGCTMITLLTPNGQSVQAFLDIDPYQKRYYYYYDDPRTGARKRVPSEWINKQDEYRRTAREGRLTDLFSGVAAGRLVFDDPNTSPALPGGHCWGEVPGADVAKRDPNKNVQAAQARDCVGGNQNGPR